MSVLAVVTGPSGAGKSTAGRLLARRLAPERFRVCDLDDAGVVDRADPAWRRRRVGALARAAEEHAGAGAGRATVLVGVIERGDLPEPMPLPVRFCLLDAADATPARAALRADGRAGRPGGPPAGRRPHPGAVRRGQSPLRATAA